ncbi:hypothetical protein B4135_2399 [Caldibacillus debilis]|uniref:Uncharacterized protein n=1 Tax=Caldibacillus debilis TaxID=301148 RepID=A0A150LZL2_9BACI|nr:hypothetical protein B4135_2399 [Caldibacillus debilis]
MSADEDGRLKNAPELHRPAPKPESFHGFPASGRDANGSRGFIPF